MEGQMINLYSFALVLALMLAGALAHWVKKKIRKEISGNLIDYLFADHPGRTMASQGSIFLTALAAAGTGAADVIDPRLLWSMIAETGSIPAISFFALGGALTTGWTLDSGINKGGA